MGSGIPAGPTWVVDPIDGTNNFVHGFPYFCVAIGVCVGGRPVVGVVYNPMTNELFHAIQDGGAYLNGERIRVNPPAAGLESCLVITEYSTIDTIPSVHADNARLVGHVRGLRVLGSAALDLCHVACGRADGFLVKGIKCWDLAAGTVIVREAGGFVADYAGREDVDLYLGSVLATSCSAIGHRIVQLLQ